VNEPFLFAPGEKHEARHICVSGAEINCPLDLAVLKQQSNVRQIPV
jgi:hypothetical protein